METPRHAAFFLVGPTAVGKSAVIHALAHQHGHAVLSADSMSVYQGMDVGTAKPGAAERSSVTYGGIDLVEPDQSFSVGQYLEHAREFVVRCAEQYRTVLVSGGTGLYVRCLTEGLLDARPVDPVLRAELEALLQQAGVGALQERLRQTAPGRLETLADPLNPRRLIRAIELARQGVAAPPRAVPRGRARVVGLRRMPPDLGRRIEERVKLMFSSGLLEEAEALRVKYPNWSGTAGHAIGYAEALTVLDGRCSVKSAMERTMTRTRQLARRQMTWFRHQIDVDWIDLSPDSPVPDTAERVLGLWQQHGRTDLAF